LRGSTYPLKLGYYGVKCRSQQNIIDNISIEKAIENEKNYFENHKVYSQYSDKLGIPFLSKSLNAILISHIKQSVPMLSENIKTSLADKERELAKICITAMSGDPLEEVDNGPLVLTLIHKFIRAYTDKLEGRFVKESATEV